MSAEQPTLLAGSAARLRGIRLDGMASPAAWSRARAGLPLSLGSFALVVAIGEADGGYFPPAWGWLALALGWVAGLALIVRAHVALGRLELAFLTLLSLLIGWIALSIAWSSDVEQSVLEVQRALVYLVGALAALLAVRRGTVAHLLAGLLAGTAWLSSRALSAKLLAGSVPGVDAISPGRLADPIGYWNALGLLAVIGALLALAFAAHGRRLPGRALAAAALPILLTTAYFTYSRGAVLALAVGLVLAVAFDGRRLAFLTTGLLLAPPSAAAVWLASQAPALNRASASRAAILEQGRELALVLLALMVASGAIALAAAALGPRLRLGRSARRACAAVLGGVAVALLAGTLIGYGGPGPLVRAAYQSFDSDLPQEGKSDDLRRRLGSIANTSRVEHWQVAVREHREQPWLGGGAGTYEQFWLRYRPANVQARDAHSLYLETLAELGWPGLVLVLGALSMPLAGAARARGQPLVAGAFGAYGAYVVHAGTDWDWEMPLITLLALSCGVALIAAREERGAPRRVVPAGWRALGIAATVAVVAFSAIGMIANRALAEAAEAVDRADFRAGEVAARTAVRWAPWSSEARRQLGRARAGLGRAQQGRASLRMAARMNPGDWQVWYDLGLASSGRLRRSAFARAATLNPLGQDIEVLREQGYRLAPREPG